MKLTRRNAIDPTKAQENVTPTIKRPQKTSQPRAVSLNSADGPSSAKTKQKRIQLELRESLKRYRSLFEASPIALWESDFSAVKRYIDGLPSKGVKGVRAYFDIDPGEVEKCARLIKIDDVNKAALKLFGAKKKEALKEGVGKFLDTRHSDAFKKQLIGLAQGKMGFETETVGKRLDGAGINVSLKLIVCAGHKATWSKILVAFNDMTERKRAESDLELKSVLLDTSIDSIIVHDFNKVIYANEAAHRNQGFSKSEFIGMPLPKIVAPEDASKMESALETLKNEGQVRYEIGHRKKNGARLETEITARVMDYSGMRVAGGIVRDISESKRIKELSDALNRINSNINSTLDFDEIMRMVVVKTAAVLGCESSGIILREGEDWLIKSVHGLPHKLTGVRLKSHETEPLLRAMDPWGPVIINDAKRDPRINRAFAERFNLRSVMAVPLIAKEEIIGALSYHYHSEPTPFDEIQLDFAVKLATSVSLAIQNVHLYEGEHEIAETLQEALLSMPIHISGIDFGCLYKSATEAAKVGGDFYDLFELEDGRVGIVMGDVAGKGIGAAAITTLVKGAIKAYAFADMDPTEVMARTNKLMVKTTPQKTFVTVFFGILDKTSGSLVYSCAGHPPAIISKGGGDVALSASGDSVIGVFPDITCKNHELRMGLGDRLILYTDGVIEARKKDGFFGETRLISSVEKSTKAVIAQVPRLIFEDVIDYTGGVLADDLALLSLALSQAPSGI